MVNQKLIFARAYEEEGCKGIGEELRPWFHLTPCVGWMNDPNGFSYYQEQYHLFYQYHPYDCFWGPMHWGHAVSKDLLHWEYLPVAMAPDMPYDKDGCFSGSATTLPDGRQLLMYTGVMKEPRADGTFVEVQTQCIATGDGKEYEKYQNNPVLTEKNLPEGGSRNDFRDPKIWRESDGSYYCVVGNCTEDRDGQILLYVSQDGLNWQFRKVLIKNNDRFGKMWECPDFFELDGKYVLLTSPQDMLPQGFEYHNGNGTLCLVGSFDKESLTFTEESDQAVDYGIDFYAPQTMLSPDGRRIMIGWMQNWDTSNAHSKERIWFGQMTLPRELSLRKDGRLIQKPIRELDALRCNKVCYENVRIADLLRLEGLEGRKIDMELTVRPGDPGKEYQKFAIRFAQNETFYTAISFRPHESVVKIDRKFSGSRRAVIHQRRCLVNYDGKELKLRIILDKFSVEVFINDGEHVMSATIDTIPDAEGISFFSDGLVDLDVVKYDLAI